MDVPTIIAIVFGICSVLVSLVGVYITWRQLQFAKWSISLTPWRNVSSWGPISVLAVSLTPHPK